MSCLFHTQYHGVGRERIPDLLEQHGIAIQMLCNSADQLEMRCTRDLVTVRLGVFRGVKALFDIQAEPEPTGLMFLRWPRALKLAEELIELVQGIELTATQCPHCKAHFSYPTQYPVDACPRCQQPLGDSEPGGDTLWFIARGNKKVGPFPWRKLKQLAAAGKFRADDLIAEESPSNQQDRKTWRRAGSVANLFPAAPRALPVAALATPAARKATPPAAAPARPPRPRRVQRAPIWMFALASLVLAVMAATTFSILRDGFVLSEEMQMVVALVNVVGVFLLGAITAAIQHRTAEPAKTFRGIASGGFCLGLLAVTLACIYRTVNERGGEIYLLCGPQSWFDAQLLQYGLAMMLVAVVAFLVPCRITMTFTGLGISLGGVLQLWVGKMALAGEVQLRAATGDGIGKLMEQFPVIPLLMGVILLLTGIGTAVGSWFMKHE